MTDETTARDCYEVVVVGGGPAGCSAGVFTGRYGLETAVFDRGAGSLDRCAFLGNYLGFPGGIDVETFQRLAHDHAREAGCDLVTDLVETVERADESDDGCLAVETQDGRRVLADSVVAATRYDAEYLRPLGGDDMFEIHEHDGEQHEHLDPEYHDADGRTPVQGLYVASPAGQWDVQAIVAAGRGAHVARSLIEDHRAEQGYPPELAKHYDWLRPDSEFAGDWSDRERWREWFDARVPEDHDVGEERLIDLRESYVDDAFETRRSDEDVDDLTAEGHRRLAGHLDPGAVVQAHDPADLVAAMDAGSVAEAVDTTALIEELDPAAVSAALADAEE